MTTHHLIAPNPKLAELREAVLAHSEKRKPKWGFRVAPDIVMELQAQPCSLLSEWVKANGYKQPVLKFEGFAVMVDRASAADLKQRPRGMSSCTRKFSLIQFDGEDNWQLAMASGWMKRGEDNGRGGWNRLDSVILAALQHDGIFTRLTPRMMLKPACMIFNKLLTDPVSMARWIGPECAATTSIQIFHEVRQQPRQLLEC